MMTILRSLSAFLFSLKTTLWLSVLLLVFFFAGAFVMPGRREFQALHSVPLFQWLGEQHLSVTWWLWAVIAILILLTMNTLFCSIESLVKKRKVTQWLLLISPQIIHVGFLLMLVAHLLSSLGAYQRVTPAGEGAVIPLDGTGMSLLVKNIAVNLDYYGYVRDWKVDVEYQKAGVTDYRDIVRPNSPSVRAGLNVNVRDIRIQPREAVLLQISREPGAPWALAGGALFTLGIFFLIALKIRMER